MSRRLSSGAIVENLIVLVIFGIWLVLSLSYPYGSVTSPGPGFLPTILGVLGLALGMGGLLSALRVRTSPATDGRDPAPTARESTVETATRSSAPSVPSGPSAVQRWREAWPLTVTICATVAFVIVLPLVGYGLAMAGLVFAYLLVGKVKPVTALLVAVLGSLGSWFLFEWLLGLPLPGDLLDRVFGL